MIPQPPEELKLIRPFIQRGNQMLKLDPIITYYCYYYAVRLALESESHKKSPECMQFVSALMEDLETRKDTLKDNELLTDDLAASAYLEAFAARVFANATRAVEARTATPKTPDTLQAAATFLELSVKAFPSSSSSPSSPPSSEGVDDGNSDDEVAKKIRFCKFHAARILKAVRDGEEINPPPPPPPPPVEEEGKEDGGVVVGAGRGRRTVSIEEVPDEDAELDAAMRRLENEHDEMGRTVGNATAAAAAARGTTAPSPPPPPPPPRQRPPVTMVPKNELEMDRAAENAAAAAAAAARGASAPSPPPPPPPPPPQQRPFRPPVMMVPKNELDMDRTVENAAAAAAARGAPPLPVMPARRNSDYFPALPAGHEPNNPGGALPAAFPEPTPTPPAAKLVYASSSRPTVVAANTHVPSPTLPVESAVRGGGGRELRPEDLTQAQKHARWAISALDYEDVDNAILQFRNGLAKLGAL